MCAIAGILDLPYNESVIQNMLGSMARRGPDGSGVAMSAGKCLLHTRLAIIDPKGGQQPMQLTWKVSRYISFSIPFQYRLLKLLNDLDAIGTYY